MFFALLLPAPARSVPLRPHAARRGVPPDTLLSRVVRRVDIVTRDIFDPLPEHGLRSLYQVVNTLHIRTRESTVRAAIVVKPGDRWSAQRGAETARQLRALHFMVLDSLYATPVGDSIDVRIVTHDNWTTSPDVAIQSGGGQRNGSVSFTERNLFGLGASFAVSSHRDPAGNSSAVSFVDNTIAGTHWRGTFGSSTGTAGLSRNAGLVLPFWAEAAPTSMGVTWSRAIFEAALYSNGTVAAQIPRRREQTVFLLGTGRRTPYGVVQRFTASFEALDDRFGVTQLEPGAPPEFAGGLEEVRIRRLGGEMFLWEPNYIVRRGVDQIGRDEDFDTGTSFAFAAGYSPQLFGATTDESFARLGLAVGADGGPSGFGMLKGSVESRIRSGPRGTLGSVSGRWISQPHPGVTAIGALLYRSGHRMPRDFQLRLGGLSGLRGYSAHELSGTELQRLNGEVRWLGARAFLQLVSIGGAAFWDAGRMRGVGSGEQPWHQDVGVGLRLALPHSAINSVVRFDVAWPLGPTLGGLRGPAYSFGSGPAF